MAKKIIIAGELESVASDHKVADASQIKDSSKNNKSQEQINTETYTHVENIDAALESLSPEQQGAIEVANKANSNEARIGYYTCNTGASTAAKAFSAVGYLLTAGGSIKIKMTYANTADNATLNINSTGAMPLYYDGERASANNTWEEGETVEVYYDGTSYYANNVAGGSGSGDGAFDVSAKYPTSGVEGGNTYTLEGALTVLNANLSASKKKGGMSIKFIQSSDNNYVQFRYLFEYSNTTEGNASFTNPGNWQEEEIPIGKSIDLSNYDKLFGWIGEDGNMRNNVDSQHYAVGLSPMPSYISIKSNIVIGARITFAQDIADDGSWTLCSGVGRIIVPTGGVENLIPPSDAKYIIIGSRSNNTQEEGRYNPDSVIFEYTLHDFSVIFENTFHDFIDTNITNSVVTCDFDILKPLAGHINTFGQKDPNQPTGLHYAVPLMEATKISVTSKDISASYYVFASSVNGNDWVNIGERISVPQDESETLMVPPNATYLVVGCRAHDGQTLGRFAPALCLINVPIRNQQIWDKIVYVDTLSEKQNVALQKIEENKQEIEETKQEIEEANKNRMAGGFTLATYNIGRLSYGVSKDSIITQSNYNVYLARYREIVKELNADMIFLEEYNDVFCANYDGAPKYTKDVLFSDYPVRRVEEDLEGTSKYNVSFFSYRYLTNITKGYLVEDTNRYYIKGEYHINGVVVGIIAAHLPHVNGDDDATAISWLNAMISLMSSYDFVIFCGDTNMVGNKAHFSALTNAGYTIANCGDFGDFPTYIVGSPNKCVDQIAVRGFKISNVRMVEIDDASDHYPLVCDLIMSNI